MNNKFNKAITAIRTSGLTVSEKELLLQKLMAKQTSPVISPWYSARWLVPVGATLLIFTLVTGGTVWAAEGALPGDILYPVKVKVIEPAGRFVAISVPAQARSEAKLATRRLEEAEELALQGKLTGPTGQKLEAKFKEHSQAFRTIENDHPDQQSITEVAENFTINLETHKEILKNLEPQTTNKDTVRDLRESVKEEIKGDKATKSGQPKNETSDKDLKPSAKSSSTANEKPASKETGNTSPNKVR